MAAVAARDLGAERLLGTRAVDAELDHLEDEVGEHPAKAIASSAPPAYRSRRVVRSTTSVAAAARIM